MQRGVAGAAGMQRRGVASAACAAAGPGLPVPSATDAALQLAPGLAPWWRCRGVKRVGEKSFYVATKVMSRGGREEKTARAPLVVDTRVRLQDLHAHTQVLT